MNSEEIMKSIESGKLILSRDVYGKEYYYEILNNGKLFHYIYLNEEFEEWVEYDHNGKDIFYKNSMGNLLYKDYDHKGNLIHILNNSGYEQWYTYNKNNEVIHYKDSKGIEVYMKSEEPDIDNIWDKIYTLYEDTMYKIKKYFEDNSLLNFLKGIINKYEKE